MKCKKTFWLICAWFAGQGRAVLTVNRKHFIALHRSEPNHAGIIVCTLDADFAGQAQRIDAALKEQPNTNGQLIRVNCPQQ